MQRLGKQDSQLIDQVKGYAQKVADRKAELETELKEQQAYADQAEVAKQKVLTQLAEAEEGPQGQREADRPAQEGRGRPPGEARR